MANQLGQHRAHHLVHHDVGAVGIDRRRGQGAVDALVANVLHCLRNRANARSDVDLLRAFERGGQHVFEVEQQAVQVLKRRRVFLDGGRRRRVAQIRPGIDFGLVVLGAAHQQARDLIGHVDHRTPAKQQSAVLVVDREPDRLTQNNIAVDYLLHRCAFLFGSGLFLVEFSPLWRKKSPACRGAGDSCAKNASKNYR